MGKPLIYKIEGFGLSLQRLIKELGNAKVLNIDILETLDMNGSYYNNYVHIRCLQYVNICVT